MCSNNHFFMYTTFTQQVFLPSGALVGKWFICMGIWRVLQGATFPRPGLIATSDHFWGHGQGNIEIHCTQSSTILCICLSLCTDFDCQSFALERTQVTPGDINLKGIFGHISKEEDRAKVNTNPCFWVSQEPSNLVSQGSVVNFFDDILFLTLWDLHFVGLCKSGWAWWIKWIC